MSFPFLTLALCSSLLPPRSVTWECRSSHVTLRRPALTCSPPTASGGFRDLTEGNEGPAEEGPESATARVSDAGGIYPGARSGARLSHRGGDHSHHSFSNGNRWEAASFSSLLLFRGHFRFSSTSRFWGQEAARILATSAGELVPSSSSEESPPPASAWGAASSLWGGQWRKPRQEAVTPQQR